MSGGVGDMKLALAVFHLNPVLGESNTQFPHLVVDPRNLDPDFCPMYTRLMKCSLWCSFFTDEETCSEKLNYTCFKSQS